MLSGLEASISDGNLQNNGQSFFVILINNLQALTLRTSFSQLPEVHNRTYIFYWPNLLNYMFSSQMFR